MIRTRTTTNTVTWDSRAGNRKWSSFRHFSSAEFCCSVRRWGRTPVSSLSVLRSNLTSSSSGICVSSSCLSMKYLPDPFISSVLFTQWFSAVPHWARCVLVNQVLLSGTTVIVLHQNCISAFTKVVVLWWYPHWVNTRRSRARPPAEFMASQRTADTELRASRTSTLCTCTGEIHTAATHVSVFVYNGSSHLIPL